MKPYASSRAPGGARPAATRLAARRLFSDSVRFSAPSYRGDFWCPPPVQSAGFAAVSVLVALALGGKKAERATSDNLQRLGGGRRQRRAKDNTIPNKGNYLLA